MRVEHYMTTGTQHQNIFFGLLSFCQNMGFLPDAYIMTTRFAKTFRRFIFHY